MALHVGVLHYTPTQEPFPLIAEPSRYEANTTDICSDEDERRFWLGVLEAQIPTVCQKVGYPPTREGTPGCKRVYMLSMRNHAEAAALPSQLPTTLSHNAASSGVSTEQQCTCEIKPRARLPG